MFEWSLLQKYVRHPDAYTVTDPKNAKFQGEGDAFRRAVWCWGKPWQKHESKYSIVNHPNGEVVKVGS